MDDPFTTPRMVRESTPLDLSPPILTRPTTSPEQLKRTLQAHLAETRKRKDGAERLGEDLVKQEEEIEARLRELEASGGKIDPELKRKLAELEKEYNEVGRETSRALLTNKIMSTGSASPLNRSNHNSNPSTLQSQGAASPSKPSRRQRNQAPSRTHDLEFAAELGQGLIAEVRKLQALLSEREEALKIVQLEKSRLEEHAESIEARLRSLDESEQRFKEENWNLELMIQDLRSQQAEQKEVETRMQVNIAQLEHEKTMVIKELDDMKHQFARISDDLETRTKHTETEIGSLRRALATHETEKTGLRSKVEELKAELEESYKTTMRLRSLQERQEADDRDDPFGIDAPDDDNEDGSPPPSPTKHTPRHGQLEAETLKSSLHHAHRMIQNLRSNMHREKTEKNELKRMLQETRDELESARSGFSSPPQKEKRRRPDGTFKKLPRSSINLLGIARKSRDEIVTESPIARHDDDWEEADLDDEDARFGKTPGAYISSVPPTDVEGDSSFETANEKDSSDVFDTATENEAYLNRGESPVYDDPTSGDELTETEGTPSRSLKPKASHLSSRSLRPLRLTKLRHQRSSIVSTASTEDEDDQYDDSFYRYQQEQEDMYSPDAEYDEEVLKTPSHVNNPRMKLRLNRARGKTTQRITSSDSSMFNSNVFGNIGSSPASGLGSPASFNDSPRGFNFRTSAVPHGLHKSLFAELGNNSPGMMSADGDEYGERNTPGRLLSPSLMPREMVEMVDSGVMTEEPYPEIPILLDDSASDAASDRPSTAVTVVNDSGMLGVGSFDRKPTLETFRELPPLPVMYDVGVQSEEEVKPSIAETGVQSDAPSTTEYGTQSDEIVLPETLEIGTQSDTASTTEFESGTQFDPELEKSEEEERETVFVPIVAPIPLPSKDEPLPEPVIIMVPREEEKKVDQILALVKGPSIDTTPGGSLETVPVEEPLPEPVIIMVPRKEEPKEIQTFTLVKGESLDTAPIEEPVVEKPALVLDFSKIMAVSTEPISPVRETAPPITAMPIITTVDTSFSSDEVTPKKVSETTDGDSSPSPPPRSTTPTSNIGRGGLGFFSSLFGPRKLPVTPERAERAASPSAKSFSMESDDEYGMEEGTVRQKNTPRRPALNMSVSTADQGIQTELSPDAFINIVKEPPQVQTPRKILFGSTSERASVREVAPTPSLRSLASTESIALPLPNRLNGEVGGVRIVSASSSVIRPDSSSSMREQRMGFPPLPEHHQEHIAAAQQKMGSSADHSMAPPPVPTQRANVSFRPRTPGQSDQSRRPITPASTSHAGTTPKQSAKYSATRSEISSPESRRSSLSSFVTEMDDRFNIQNDGYPARGAGSESPSTDPRVIQAITQTMIGEYLWKYTRNTGRGTISHTRHKRFFWIHPYTRTLYWSDRDPQSAGRAELRAKSVAIEAVRVVTDDNPMPPGLHRKSLVIITPGRTLKFTAPTSQRHETWFSALSYLLLRDGQDGAIDDTAALNDDDMRDYNPQGGYSTESSLRPTVRGAASYSSFRSRVTREPSPTRNASSLSNRRPTERERMQGSLSRLSNIFRPASAFGSHSSRNDNSVYGISEDDNSTEDLQQMERQEVELERMENVRACCDGKHDVGTLPRKGGKAGVFRRGQAHNHSHSHG
ncbi:hypothetical protein BZA05DRAFT_332519 [Tricharina praecox]|uniref:uncharacterized protein n=1 Tax=Tricharina praecox TaxID=43433 RepID=UPI0022208508|nr:uncharacterized protein BZA05DRAFT_332519 [Tricharina praecox]KAI5856465.1 hypothetical protein BZA05DRAFT_332519 [Tricharina praecox]